MIIWTLKALLILVVILSVERIIISLLGITGSTARIIDWTVSIASLIAYFIYLYYKKPYKRIEAEVRRSFK